VDIDTRTIKSPFSTPLPAPHADELSADLEKCVCASIVYWHVVDASGHRALNIETGKAMSRQIAYAFRRFYDRIIVGYPRYVSVEPPKPTGRPKSLAQRIVVDKERFAADSRHSRQTRKARTARTRRRVGGLMPV
jgi:hypothetical protein